MKKIEKFKRPNKWEINGSSIIGIIRISIKNHESENFAHRFFKIEEAEKFAEDILEFTKHYREVYHYRKL